MYIVSCINKCIGCLRGGVGEWVGGETRIQCFPCCDEGHMISHNCKEKLKKKKKMKNKTKVRLQCSSLERWSGPQVPRDSGPAAPGQSEKCLAVTCLRIREKNRP